MKLYKTKKEIVIEKQDTYYLINEQNWDTYINDDRLYSKLEKATKDLNPNPEAKEFIQSEVQAPIQSQEIWACGVTYYRSKAGRQEESAINQIKRNLQDLVSYLYRETSFPHGCLLMTGTGIVPSSDFTLQKDDEIRITIQPIGTLVNTVK